MKKIGFLITARLKSKRLPKKLLKEINGKTIIEHVISRIKEVDDLNDIVLCTSTSHQDLPLVDIAIKNNIYYFNGDEEDVLSRLLTASKLFGLDYMIGITGENPLFSIEYTNLIIEEAKNSDFDFIYLKGLPIGCATYAIKTKALETVCAIKNVVDTEIWGYLINRPELFNIKAIEVEQNIYWPDLRITIDYEEDFNFVAEIFKNLDSESIKSLPKVLAFLRENNQITQIHQHHKQLDLSENVKNEIDSYFKNNYIEILETKNKIYNTTAL